LIDKVKELNDRSEEKRTCSQQGEDDLNDAESERDNDEGLYEVEEFSETTAVINICIRDRNETQRCGLETRCAFEMCLQVRSERDVKTLTTTEGRECISVPITQESFTVEREWIFPVLILFALGKYLAVVVKPS
jgi:hypothetical protein